MARTDAKTPTIPVLERSFALLDVLAAQPESVAFAGVNGCC